MMQKIMLKEILTAVSQGKEIIFSPYNIPGGGVKVEVKMLDEKGFSIRYKQAGFVIPNKDLHKANPDIFELFFTRSLKETCDKVDKII